MTRLLAHVRGNAVAYVALFVALGGTTYAAVRLPRNSVGAKQIKRGAVTGAKVRKDTLTGRHIKEAKLGKVPLAAHADTADAAASATNAANAGNANTLGGQPASAFLPAGGKASDAALLGGQPASAFLGANAKAADADRWDGIDSSVLGHSQSFTGSSFNPSDTGTQKAYDGFGIVHCGSGGADFHLDVHLPQGAAIQGMDFSFVDDNGSADSVLTLLAFDGVTGTAEPVVQVISTGDNSTPRTASTELGEEKLIDNDAVAYVLDWFPAVCSAEEQLVGARIRYVLPTE